MEAKSGVLPCPIQLGECFAGKYLVERVLGSGGMSVVVAAVHQGLRQRVAIKLVSAPNQLPADGVSRFLREARAAAALRSEHTARVVDVDIDDRGRHFIVMEHLDGQDLGDVLRRGPALPIETAVGYMLHACEAMAEAHSLGIIHRDLKPQNLFLTRRIDGSPLVKVLDFGVSKVVTPRSVDGRNSSVSTRNVLLGTPHYMAPEQIRTPAEIDGRIDVWAMGVTLFELLTGTEPFTGATLPDVIAAVLQNAPVSPASLRAEIPSALAAVVLGCLEKDVARRIANVGVLARELRPWAPVWAQDAAERAERICSIGASEALERTAQPSPEPEAWAVPRESQSSRGPSPRAEPERSRRLMRLVYAGVATLIGVAGVLFGSLLMTPRSPTAEDLSGRPSSARAERRLAASPVEPARPAPPDAMPADPLAPPAPVSSTRPVPAPSGTPAEKLDPATPAKLSGAAPAKANVGAPPAKANVGAPAHPAPVAAAVQLEPAGATAARAHAPQKPANVRVAERSKRGSSTDPLAERL